MPAPKGHPPYNVNGEGGRPKRYTNDHVNHLAECLENWINTDKENFLIEDWCLEFNVPEETISKELVNFERFSQAYKKLKTKQKSIIIKGGLKRKFAHPMCALVLSCNHGMHQKTEQKLTGDVANPIAFLIGEVDGLTKDLVDE